ncbi:hypothetical protein EsDP_00006745 [Epichloe bromicola]|uniref:Conidiation-specific protein 13 n=1 Tax=Epichloe bromicola TaxID=79588 RepID=A0ABQ0CYJ5_9HYPO
MYLNVSILATLGSLALAANPDKPAINPGTDWQTRETGLLNNLPPVGSRRDYWAEEWIPTSCKEKTKDYHKDPADITVWDAHYDDCSAPWTMCRHKDCSSSEDELTEYFGRVPIHMRQWVRHVICMPQTGGDIAYAVSGGDIIWERKVSLSTFLHEVSHQLDTSALPQFTQPFSDSNEWQSSYAMDSATITGYGRTNWRENFADTAPDAIYDKFVAGGFESINPSWETVSHQYTSYQDYLGDMLLPQGTCDMHRDNSPTVAKADGDQSALQFDLGTRPDISIKDENITVIENDAAAEGINLCGGHF